MIDGLPRNSEFIQALTDDDELAEQLLDKPPATGSASVRMADWSPQLELMHLMVDRLGQLIQATVATIPKAKVPKIPPMPRPRTAADRVRSARRERAHRALVARVLPPRNAS